VEEKPTKAHPAAPVRTQIYGITTPEDAALVNALRPDHVGVVLDEGIPTWDSVDPATLRAIRPELTDVAVVALSLSAERDRILRTVEAVHPPGFISPAPPRPSPPRRSPACAKSSRRAA
jgi:hypothetical protein